MELKKLLIKIAIDKSVTNKFTLLNISYTFFRSWWTFNFIRTECIDYKKSDSKKIYELPVRHQMHRAVHDLHDDATTQPGVR